MSRIGIIGGGPAGLALAHDLSGAGHQITVFEARPELGGLARSFQFGDIHIDRYYHFLCSGDTGYFRKLRELGIEDRLRWEPTRMGFFYNGRLYPFSSGFDLLNFDGISVAGRFRYGLLTLYCWSVNRWQGLDSVPAETWLTRLLGSDTYMATWYPLLRVKFSQYHDQVSAAWAWHRVHRVARSRKTLLHREMLGFLQGGTSTLLEALAAALRHHGTALELARPVERIVTDGNRVVGVQTADGQQWPFDCVVSTVPLPVFLRMMPSLPVDYRSRLATIDFIGVICLTLRLRQSLTDNYWLNINDPRVPFNGCIEYTNLNEKATPDRSTILYVPYYLPCSHERFGYSDERLLQECVDALKVVNPDFSADWVADCAVSRDPFAQVICRTGFMQEVPAHETPIRDLYLIDSSQLYPSDRTISGTIDLARNVASIIAEAEHSKKPRATSMSVLDVR